MLHALPWIDHIGTNGVELGIHLGGRAARLLQQYKFPPKPPFGMLAEKLRV